MTLTAEQLTDYAAKHYVTGTSANVFETDCDFIVFLLENCEITVPRENRFFVNVNCAGVHDHIRNLRCELYAPPIPDEMLAGTQSLAYTGYCDFGHTSAEWNSVISLGIYGLKSRIEWYAQKYKNDVKKLHFYTNTAKVYDAALNFLKRASQVADAAGKDEMAQGLLNLASNPPSNLFEAMQLSIIYYTLQHIFDGTYLRTLGRLDSLFYPFFKSTDKNTAAQLLEDFIKEIDRLNAPANIPFAIAGTDAYGNSLANQLSYMIIDAYEKAHATNVKFHVLCADNTPGDLIKRAFDAVRNGNNSIVFMSDKKITEALEKLGEDHADAADYHVVGCYECGGNGEITCSCNARVNIPKALELAINGGKDMITDKSIGLQNNGVFQSYDDLYNEFKRQLVHLCNCATKLTDIQETHCGKLHSAPVLSATYTSALENGGDIYCDFSAKYNNSSVNAIGLATATDSLAAIKKAVFEDKLVTLAELTEILKQDWHGNEHLRLKIKNKFPKYGNGDKSTDAIAKDIVDTLAQAISGKPNVKGGKYRLGLFSINWRWELGEKTAASADGRFCGQPLSQNTSATFGADKNGATAHFISASAIDTSLVPNGAIVDIDLHSSAVHGAAGLDTLASTLKTYFDMGGFAVHYNVLNTEVLKACKAHPEKYSNLQVRLCGWNVLFSSLSDKEKDEFIARSIR